MPVCKDLEKDRGALYLSQGLQTCATGMSWEVAGPGALSTELQEVLSEVMVHCQGGLLKSTDKPHHHDHHLHVLLECVTVKI